MLNSTKNIVYKNLANTVSILGVLPICFLFVKDGYHYLVPLIIYNNIMDDLDGILATKLNIKSRLGANLDNLCDAIAHTVFVMVVGVHFLGEDSVVAAAAIVLRVATRLNPNAVAGIGSPTNELIRHIMFVLLLAQNFSSSPVPFLIAVFAIHAVSMLVPFGMPYQIRSLAKSPIAIIVVNMALVMAWLIPLATPVIAAGFIAAYLYSFVLGTVRWTKAKG